MPVNKDDYGRRRPPVSITEQMDIIDEYPERYADLVGYFSLPLTNVEFKQDGNRVYWRVVGSTQWKVLFDMTTENKKGMRFLGEVPKWSDIKQLIVEEQYDPQQGDVWKIISKNKVILYYQNHWVTLFEGIDINNIKHSHSVEDIKGLEEFVRDKIKDVVYDTKVISQDVPSKEWEIEHNMNRFPSVSVVDSGGNVVYGDIEYNSPNKITIRFCSEFSGKAYLN